VNFRVYDSRHYTISMHQVQMESKVAIERPLQHAESHGTFGDLLTSAKELSHSTCHSTNEFIERCFHNGIIFLAPATLKPSIQRP
jgi:hypothetical protein